MCCFPLVCEQPGVSLLRIPVHPSPPDCKQFSADLALYSNFLLLETFPWDLAQGVAEGNPVSFIQLAGEAPALTRSLSRVDGTRSFCCALLSSLKPFLTLSLLSEMQEKKCEEIGTVSQQCEL